MIELQAFLQKLVSYESVTPDDAGCQAFLKSHLKAMGFDIQTFDNPPVSNFYAQIGHNAPLFVFAGHTDVVPLGDVSKWHQPNPFELHVDQNIAYGRGTADMKGSIASMIFATEQFLKANQPTGSIGFLITSGEEGDNYNQGTPYVMTQLAEQNIKPKYCIVGEPTSQDVLGDTIKVGRRGSLTAHFTFKGKQGHVAYPHLAKNPIHQLAPAISEITNHSIDEGNDFFSPSTLQITHIDSGGHGGNVIPGTLILQFNIRYNTEQTDYSLIKWIEAVFARHQLDYKVRWQHNGKPFLTPPGVLVKTASDAIKNTLGLKALHSTTGGTSDARFIAPHQIEVIELGPIHKSIHQVNEHVDLHDLEKLTRVYSEILKKLLL